MKKSKTEIFPSRSAKAVAKFLRISPRKVRLVINPIRHQPAEKAFRILMTFKKKAARMAEKLLKSAVANAKVLGLEESRLYVSDVRADGGPSMKRFMSRSMGKADRILKRSTHLSLVVSEGGEKTNDTAAPEVKEEKAEGGAAGKKKLSFKEKAAAAGAK